MGYTLPVFACASAIAALNHLQEKKTTATVTVDLIKPPQQVQIPIEQVARIDHQSALAITRSDPGEHLDITRNTPIWALVTRSLINSNDSIGDKSGIEENSVPASEIQQNKAQITIQGGEGIGIQSNQDNQAAIYTYAQELITYNLQTLSNPQEKITVKIILPEGKELGKRTSNEAFGVVEGLSLLGTTGLVQPLTAPSQLEAFQQNLATKASKNSSLVFCIGENGLDLAVRWGISEDLLVKTANWVGSMLVAAATHQVRSIILLGYHGKLIKLAGGIWHTHHHLADARLEILVSFCALQGLSTPKIQLIADSPTTEAALQLLKKWDEQENTIWTTLIYREIAKAIEKKAQSYIEKHTQKSIMVGSILFDRQREIIIHGDHARREIAKLC